MNVYNVNMDGYNNANFPYISAFHSNASYAGIENAIARHGLVWQFASGIMLTRGIGRWSWWRQQRTRVCTRCQAVFCLPKTLWRNNTQNSCNIVYEHEQYSPGNFWMSLESSPFWQRQQSLLDIEYLILFFRSVADKERKQNWNYTFFLHHKKPH